ncbi:MAG TPA: sulfurtransferase [Actinopolymorphaceae bacterium]|nr:sulfurtransferase [Actinopolymorphaceae bacterium]
MSEFRTSRRDVVVTADELLALLGEGTADADATPKAAHARADVVVLEVGDLSSGGDLRAEYATGHIPGAAYVSFEDVLRGVSTGANGNGPLPEPADIEARIRGWGIEDGTTVVVYGRGRPGPVARAWFVLRWAGVADVRYLDGGWAAWISAVGRTSAEVAHRAPTTFVVKPGSLPTLTAAEAASLPGRGVLLDARAHEAYAGSSDQTDTTGHIPGAVSAPSAQLRGDDGSLLDDESIAAYFRRRGVDGSTPVGVYCGTGVSATFDLLALHAIGVPAAVFVGSWSEWISDPSRPVEQAEPPSCSSTG